MRRVRGKVVAPKPIVNSKSIVTHKLTVSRHTVTKLRAPTPSLSLKPAK